MSPFSQASLIFSLFSLASFTSQIYLNNISIWKTYVTKSFVIFLGSSTFSTMSLSISYSRSGSKFNQNPSQKIGGSFFRYLGTFIKACTSVLSLISIIGRRNYHCIWNFAVFTLPYPVPIITIKQETFHLH